MTSLSWSTPSPRSFIRIVAVALIYAAMARAGFMFTRAADHIPLLWLPGALLVGVLMRMPVRDHLACVLACLLANVGVEIMSGIAVAKATAMALACGAEAIVIVSVVRRGHGDTPDIATLPTLLCLVTMCIIAPAASGLIAAVALPHVGPTFDSGVWFAWLIADGLGLLIGTPLIVIAIDAWRARRMPDRAKVVEWAVLVGKTTLGAILIFAQTRYPFLFLACPLVVIAAFRSGVTGTAAAIALISVVAAVATSLGYGPIMLVRGDLGDKVIALQAFLATNFVVGLPVAAAVSGRNAISKRLVAARDFTQTILDNVDDIIFKTDAQGRWIFLNPAWERISGYTVAESIGWSTARLLHPDDRAAANETYPLLARGEIGEAVLNQRFLRRDGEYRHIEVTVRRVANDDGSFAGTIGNIRDVSIRIAQERALADSERRFRRMAEASPVGIFLGGPTGGLTYVNRAFTERLGLTQEEAMGDGWMAGLTDASTFVDDPAWQGFNTPSDVRHRILHFRGTQPEGVWVETVNSAEFDEDGAVVGFIGAVIDITEQRRATQQLMESERRFQALANLAPAGIFRTDADGNCNYVNMAWLRITGLGPDEWQNEGWVHALHPDDAERVATEWGDAVRDMRDFRAEFRWRHRDGTDVWVDVLGRPEVDDAGMVTGFIGVTMDITERRDAEAELARRDEQLTLLATNATDAVFRLTLEGQCLYASPSARALLGVDPALVVGHSMLARFHPDDDAAVHEAFAAMATGEIESVILAYRSERLSTPGAYVWLEANCGVVRDRDTGEPSEIIASIRDVSAKKALEAELIDATRRAEEAVMTKTAFLANMSHEIRTPMNGVIGFTELLLSDDLRDDQRRHVQLIAESGRSMMRLLNDILDMSKIEAGQMGLASEAVDVRHVLRGACRLMEPVAMAKGVDVSIRVDPAIPRWIDSDQLRLRQIVLNLIGNAAKFTEEGWIEVHASIEGEADTPFLRIDVRDSGVGIAADQLDLVFQQFAQADNTIARRFGGSGLGLPISAKLAQLMGGTISVASELGTGTTFTVRLPMTEATAVEASSDGEDAEVAPIATAARRPRVLIAEDHDINQTLIVAMATRAGMDPVIANNGAEAVAMATAAEIGGNPYALVLMDMQMPVVDGLEATRQLRAAGYDADRLPIVALTANAYAEDIAACLAAGMQSHLTKPVRLRDLERLAITYGGDAEPEPAAVPAAADGNGLSHRFAARRTELLDRIAMVIRQGGMDGEELTTLCTMLHQFAGTAGFFGQAAQGTAAAALERDLHAVGTEGATAVLIDRWRALDVAA
jgi:PAS domain S-box-containing protein